MPTKIITDIGRARKEGLLKNGHYFVRVSDGLRMYLPFYFLNRVDLTNLLLYTGSEIEMNRDIPDMNALVARGEIREEKAYREYEIRPDGFPDCRSVERIGAAAVDQMVKRVREEFRRNGFRVTRKAIEHNFFAWMADLKSGYRDERNRYHLFTPCGCNPLRFSATSLFEGSSWQDTYAI